MAGPDSTRMTFVYDQFNKEIRDKLLPEYNRKKEALDAEYRAKEDALRQTYEARLNSARSSSGLKPEKLPKIGQFGTARPWR